MDIAEKLGLTPVKSSIVSAVGYDAQSQTLHMKFPSGKIYAYEGVSAEQHDQLMAAESIGKHFGTEIRGRFKHHLLDLDEQKP